MARKQVFSCDTTTEGDVQGKRDRCIFSTLQYICNGTFFKNNSRLLPVNYNCKKICHWCLVGLKYASVLSCIQI